MMGKKKSLVKIIGLGILALALFVTGFFALFLYAYKPTPDGERISTEADLRMVVDLPGVNSTPSRAITVTYYAKDYDSFSDLKKDKIRMRTSGRVEGDIPCVYTDSKERSKIEFIIQDLNYNNVLPAVKKLSIYRYSWPPQEGMELRHESFAYVVNYGKITFYASDFAEKNALDDDSENGVFEIRYEVDGEEYISISAVNVLKDDSDPFEE